MKNENTLGEPEKKDSGAMSFTEAGEHYLHRFSGTLSPQTTKPDIIHKSEVEERVEEKGDTEQFAIGFAEWIMKDGWRYNKFKGNWSKDVKWNSFITKTTTEILELYKQSI
jgi:hypothetical protein